MPAKNSRKEYISNSYYHIYNRGVEKRIIFLDSQDYRVFLLYLKTYLLPKDTDILQKQLATNETSEKEKDTCRKLLRLNNFSEDIQLNAYCLMPNHFHLLLYQKSENAIDTLMNSLGTRYTSYFNKRYKRVGPLYQGVYKAVQVTTDEQLLHLTRYIHRNPFFLQGVASQVQPSSYYNYINVKQDAWVHPEHILSFFSEKNPLLTYQSFVESSVEEELITKIELDNS